MSVGISPVSFGSRMPKHRVNTAKIVDSANRAVENFRLSKKTFVEQKEVAMRKSIENFSLKKVFRYVLDSLTDPKAQ